MKYRCLIGAFMSAVMFSASCGVYVSAQENGAAPIVIEHGRTAEEVTVMHKELVHSGFEAKTTQYEAAPLLTAPYFAGSLKKEAYTDALNALKMTRFLAGVPYKNVSFTDEYNNIAQHGAVLLAASDQFTHFPGKPMDMSEEFYDIGKKGCSSSNISAGRNNVSGAVLGFVYDAGQNNIASAGHRRWALQPENLNFGVGFAKGNGSYGGYRIAMYTAGNVYERDTYDGYVAWPSDGDFPLQYLYGDSRIKSAITCPWTINLGREYAVPQKKNTVVKLVRKSDGKVWIFDKSVPNLANEKMTDDKMHFNVESTGVGMMKAIVFRPDVASLGAIADGESFSVEVKGIRYADGSDAVISYDINFFDLEKKKRELDSYYESGGMKALIPEFPVTMNGVTIDNEDLEYPFILYNNITYFPMTYFDSRFLGIGTSYTPEEGLGVFRLDVCGEYNGELRSCSNVPYYKVMKAEGKITVNGKDVDNSSEEYPLLLFRDVTYFPMTWRFCVDEFGWSYHFDFDNGLVIDTAVR